MLFQKILDWIQQFCYGNSKQKRTQQMAFNHSSDIDFQDIMNLYKKCDRKPYSFLVTDAAVASDNHLRFRKNILEIV